MVEDELTSTRSDLAHPLGHFTEMADARTMPMTDAWATAAVEIA